MRSHSALYVDAGYLLAAAATRVTGTSLRSGIEPDQKILAERLTLHAEGKSPRTAARHRKSGAPTPGRFRASGRTPKQTRTAVATPLTSE